MNDRLQYPLIFFLLVFSVWVRLCLLLLFLLSHNFYLVWSWVLFFFLFFYISIKKKKLLFE